MAPPRKEITPEVIEAARVLYEQTGTPLQEIARQLGISRGTLNGRISEWGWPPRSSTYASYDPDLLAVTKAISETVAQDDSPEPPIETLLPTEVTAQDRLALGVRIHRAVCAEFDVIDRVLKSINPAGPGGAERATRTLALISRVIREASAANSAGEMTSDETEADDVPIDIDAFRFELARRINEFVEAERDRSGEAGDPSLAEDDAAGA